jgi:type 1 glutamine amidotransferase
MGCNRVDERLFSREHSMSRIVRPSSRNGLPSSCLLAIVALGWALAPGVFAADTAPRRVVVVAGKKSHGPVGNGIHDYGWSARLIKVMLDNSNVRDRVVTEFFLDGWPPETTALERADTILVISDGRDGDLFEETPFLASEERVRFVAQQIARGCGFLTFHFSTFAPDRYSPQVLDWTGGYFDWETEGKREWYSAIKTLDTPVEVTAGVHPIGRGLEPVQLREEFYYNLRFAEDKQGITPIWRVPALDGRDPDGRVVAWARERANGGRGFGTTCGHFYDNWKQPQFRRLMLNALLWTARSEVPEGGVESRFFTHDEITAALSGVEGTARAEVDDRPLRVQIYAGNEAHKWHNWEKTTPAIQALLEKDPRVQVRVSHTIEDLARLSRENTDVVVQNYVNWHDPSALSAESRTAFVRFLEQGGGLVLVHFANGAWHFSLPMAEAAAWPEYQKIVRRMWNHKGQSGHDAFGRFTVRPTELSDPITAGLGAFEVNDELYFRQEGEGPVEPLITARSKVTGQDEPLAWTYSYGQGRVFQTLLGHSEQTYHTFEAREMLRRAVAWTARRKMLPLSPTSDPVIAGLPVPSFDGLLREGKLGQALDTRKGGALAPGRAEYHELPITVECWVRLFQKQTYNILVASELKSSPTHWELFTQPGSGHLTLFSPGMQPDHVGTTVDLADGQWHFVRCLREAERVRIFVDGRQAADQKVKRQAARSTDDGLGLGTLVDRAIGCVGWLDDVRISRGLRDPEGIPSEPLSRDDATLGLWRFDKLVEGELADESPRSNAASPVAP